MSVAQIVKCGELAIELYYAEEDTRAAKSLYHAAWRKYECGGTPEEYCDHDERITRADVVLWDAAIEATKIEYANYRHKMDIVRNFKRRLKAACKVAI